MIGKSLSRSWPFTLAIAMIGLIASPATANYAALHPDGKTGCDGPVYRADNKTHYYAFTGATQVMQDATKWADNNSIGFTVVDAVLRPDVTSQTDVKVTDYPYSGLCGYTWYGPGVGGLVGLYVCETNLSNGRCQQAIVRYNTNYTNTASTDSRRSVACHEMGHSLGLLHRDGSCMAAGEDAAPYYSPHDKDHLSVDFG